jgi:hypothetical protein
MVSILSCATDSYLQVHADSNQPCPSIFSTSLQPNGPDNMTYYVVARIRTNRADLAFCAALTGSRLMVTYALVDSMVRDSSILLYGW